MDVVFDALADPTRRAMLDALRARDGQTQSELAKPFAMTRFGVMRHLKVLEAAGLVATRKVGREKFHYLNPVPLQQLMDRWMSRYAQPFARAMVDLKGTLENKDMPVMPPKQVYTIYIRCTPQDVWNALTDPDQTPRWHNGYRIVSDWRPGSPVRMTNPDGRIVVEGEVIAVEAPSRLSWRFHGQWDEEVIVDRPSRVTWEIEAAGELTKIVAVHDDFEGETATFRAVAGGWPMMISALKTLLETGEPLRRAA